jgi:hypothetical protein
VENNEANLEKFDRIARNVRHSALSRDKKGVRNQRLSFKDPTKHMEVLVTRQLFGRQTTPTVCLFSTHALYVFAGFRSEVNDIMYLIVLCGPGSSVGIATDYGLDGPGIESAASVV